MAHVLALQKMAPEATTAALRMSILSIECNRGGNSIFSLAC